MSKVNIVSHGFVNRDTNRLTNDFIFTCCGVRYMVPAGALCGQSNELSDIVYRYVKANGFLFRCGSDNVYYRKPLNTFQFLILLTRLVFNNV